MNGHIAGRLALRPVAATNPAVPACRTSWLQHRMPVCSRPGHHHPPSNLFPNDMRPTDQRMSGNSVSGRLTCRVKGIVSTVPFLTAYDSRGQGPTPQAQHEARKVRISDVSVVRRWMRRQITASPSLCPTESTVGRVSAGMPFAGYGRRCASLHAHDGGQIDVLVFDGRVVSLQIDRARCGRSSVNGPGCRTDSRLVVDDFDSTQDDRHVPVDQS